MRIQTIPDNVVKEIKEQISSCHELLDFLSSDVETTKHRWRNLDYFDTQDVH